MWRGLFILKQGSQTLLHRGDFPLFLFISVQDTQKETFTSAFVFLSLKMFKTCLLSEGDYLYLGFRPWGKCKPQPSLLCCWKPLKATG